MTTLMKELAFESRMIQSVVYFSNYSAKDMGEYIFLSILALEVLKKDPQFDNDLHMYADRTVRYHNYHQFMSYNTDLYNFIYILFGHDEKNQIRLHKTRDSLDYIKHLKTNEHYFMSKLDQYLRNIRNHTDYHLNDRQFLLFAENYLHITEPSYRNARRIIMDWDHYDWKERQIAVSRLIQVFRLKLVNHDLRPFLEKFSRDNELVMKGLCNPETGENCGNAKMDFIKRLAMLAAERAVEKFLDLDESFSSPVKWEKKGKPGLIEYNFSIGGYNYNASFGRDRRGDWDFEFINLNAHDKKFGQGVTGTGNPMLVFSTVINIIKSFIVEYKPEYLSFEAYEDEPSRVKLYRTLMKSFGPQLDRMGYATASSSTGDFAHHEEGISDFAIMKKDVNETASAGSTSAGCFPIIPGNNHINNNTIGAGFDTDYSKSIYGKPKKKKEKRKASILKR